MFYFILFLFFIVISDENFAFKRNEEYVLTFQDAM